MNDNFKGSLEAEPSLQALPGGYDIHAAYMLWYCVGYVGAHNFYLKKFRHGILILALFLVGLATIPVKFGIIPLTALAVLLILDFIKMPKTVMTRNREILLLKDLPVPSQQAPKESLAASKEPEEEPAVD